MKVKIPYNFEPREYQRHCLANKHRFKIIVWHRRSGKTKMAWNEIIRQAFLKKGRYYYIAPSYSQAKKIIWRDPTMMEHLPLDVVEKKNDSELYIKFKNGSQIFLVGGDDPDSLRGISGDGFILDEFAEMKPQVWQQIIRPIVFESKGWVWFIFTPKGRNHAWELWEQARLRRGWYRSLLKASENEFVNVKELEEEKETMPEAFFSQEYECEFLEGAGAVFKRIDENIYKEALLPEPDNIYQCGVDLAKYQDWTVLTAIDLHTFQIMPIERFHRVDWQVQKARIEAFVRRHNNARTFIDATGIGDPIFDDLLNRGINVHEYKFTERSREALLNNLAILIEQDKLQIPNDEILINELKSFQYTLTSTKKIKMIAPEGMHDDCVMSLALACWQIGDPLKKEDKSVKGTVIEPIIERY